MYPKRKLKENETWEDYLKKIKKSYYSYYGPHGHMKSKCGKYLADMNTGMYQLGNDDWQEILVIKSMIRKPKNA